MALRWLEGFEGVSTVVEGHARLYEVATGADMTARNGANEGTSAGNAVQGYNNLFTTNPLVGSPENEWIVGIAFWGNVATTINNGDIPYIALKNDDGEQVRLEFVESNPANSKPGGVYFKIRAMRGATELASSVDRFPIGLSEDLWLYFEFKVTIDNSNGSIEGRYRWPRKAANGASTTITWDASVTSIDTQNQTSTGADRFELAMTTGNASNTVVVDDIYVCDSTGSKNNDFLGKVVIENQDVSGTGTTAEWTLAGSAADTEDAWNEPANAIEDDKRLTTDVTSDIHLATVASLTYITTGATIIGVRQDLHAKMETTGDLDLAHMWRKTTGTPAQTNSGSLNVDSTTYTGSAVVLEDDPNTATDWVVADLNSYQHGARNDG